MLTEAAKDEERKCEENQYVNRLHFSSTLFLIICILYLYNAILELCYLAVLTLINYSTYSFRDGRKKNSTPSFHPTQKLLCVPVLVFTK
jgi:hypothetical protein